MNPRHVLIVGAGMAGLACASRLRQLGGDQLRITVAEEAPRLGGKVASAELAGVPIETGAESFLARRPEVGELAETVGLADAIVHPARLSAALYSRGALRDMPRGTVMGLPTDPAAAEPIVSSEAVSRARVRDMVDDSPLLGAEDTSVGSLVRRRYGDEFADRLVDPLLGGVYAGNVDGLSLDVTMPGLAAAARTQRSLSQAVAASLPPRSDPSAPVFGSIETGLTRLIEQVAETADAELLLRHAVRELRRTPHGWEAVAGPTREPMVLTADAVVLAVPARPAARLLEPFANDAAAPIQALDYASVVLAAMALPPDATQLPEMSGFLVPGVEGFTLKAATFMTRKWPHLDRGTTLVRVSMGRFGQERQLQEDDDEILALAHQELSTILRRQLPRPIDSAVYRWGGGLPQYSPGHAQRIRRARRALEGQPIALAGAAFDGVGLPACVASGYDAADQLWDVSAEPQGPA